MESVLVRKRENSRKRQAKHYNKNKVDQNQVRKNKYNLAREKGFSSYDANKVQKWNMEKLLALFESGKTLEEFLIYWKERGK